MPDEMNLDQNFKKDQPTGGVEPPEKPPISEVEDMFASDATEQTPSGQTQPRHEPTQPATAGPIGAQESVVADAEPDKEELSKKEGLSAKQKIILIIVAVVVVAILVVGGYFLYGRLGGSSILGSENINQNTNSSALPVVNKNVNQTTNINQNENLNLNQNLNLDQNVNLNANLNQNINQAVNLNQNLNTNQAVNQNTNQLVDTDSDGLSDQDEAVYGTDPTNPDTDGDGYLDGAEVKSGYNPLGSGKL